MAKPGRQNRYDRPGASLLVADSTVGEYYCGLARPSPPAPPASLPIMLPRRLSLLPLLAVVALVVGTPAAASEYRESDDFAVAVNAACSYAESYGPANTWLVIDIDNTLLAMEGDLGSDQWFEWQEYLLKHEPDSPHLVADDFSGLLDAQDLLFTLGKMRPPQDNLPELVRMVQDRGIKTLVLTSRGPSFRPATERDLKAAGYDSLTFMPKLTGVPTGEYLPYDAAVPESAGLSAAEMRLYELSPEPRPASLINGVFMTSGQHKGAMLLTAIHRAETKPKAVVFVDDHGRHVQRVYDAMLRRDIDVTVVHYKREDATVARFRYGDKRDVTEKWRRLESALTEVFNLPPAAARPHDTETGGKAHATADAGADTPASR
ncbi:MAG: DUF2608 domain-containing protein [Planctomycetota bacterium]